MTIELIGPMAAFLFSILICIVYFSKKRVNLVENIMYSVMLICVPLDSLLVIIEKGLVIGQNITDLSSIRANFILFCNKLDMLLLTMICASIFLYIVKITIKISERNFLKYIHISYILNFICFIVSLFLNLELIQKGPIISVAGFSLIPIYLLGGLYILISVLICVFNYKRISIKHLPLLITIIMFILIMLIFYIDPFITIISVALAFINLTMYFTIENPDVKMIALLENSKDAAEKANRAKSDFLSSMSHEIRTPLNAIVGLSEDIVSYQDQVPAEVVEDSKDIQNASHTLLEIVGNILDISKIESDKMEIIDTTYNFKEEIEGMCRVTATRIGDKNINFHLNIADDIPYELVGDKGKVKEVINNLLTNSIKYTDEGEVNLSIKCVNDNNTKISTLFITCQDTGKGIKEDMIKRLFNKFDRLDIEKNTTTEGTGLGLAITKSLVEMMGGKINVQSQFGKGSIFMVSIPQKIAEIEKPLTNTQVINIAEVQRIINDNLKGKKVLIVDDNKLNIKVARKAIQDFGFEIDDCTSGKECIEKVKSGIKYDLILMDIMMPEMSGESTLLVLMEDDNFNTPVIALTADAVAGARDKYVSEGFIDYLSKPFSREEIKEKLNIIFKP